MVEILLGNYSPTIYYLSKFIEEAVLATFTSFLFGIIVFWACSLQGSFLVFAAVYYLTTMCGICLAYAVAAIAPNMDAANALLPTAIARIFRSIVGEVMFCSTCRMSNGDFSQKGTKWIHGCSPL